MPNTYRLNSHGMFDRRQDRNMRRVIFLSVEGTKTEVEYFGYINKYKTSLGVESVVEIHVLKRDDTKSSPEQVLDLLDEYMSLRTTSKLKDELQKLELSSYDVDFIQSYLDAKERIPDRQRKRFEATLMKEHLDLLYLKFLSDYQGESDIFGVVIDRDSKSHPRKMIEEVFSDCDNKGYKCFLTNPCIELWLLLHVSDISEEYKHDMNNLLENPIDKQGHTYVGNLLYEKTNIRKSIQLKAFEKYFLPNIENAIENAAKICTERNNLLDRVGSNLGELFALLREKPKDSV